MTTDVNIGHTWTCVTRHRTKVVLELHYYIKYASIEVHVLPGQFLVLNILKSHGIVAR